MPTDEVCPWHFRYSDVTVRCIYRANHGGSHAAGGFAGATYRGNPSEGAAEAPLSGFGIWWNEEDIVDAP